MIVLIWLGFTIVLLIINRKRNWLQWLKRWGSPEMLPLVVFSAIYLAAITLTVYTADHPITDFYDDRYQSPLFFVCIVGIFLSLDELVLAHVRETRRQAADWVVVLVFAIWAIYPSAILYRFTRLSIQQGVAAYNNYNTRELNESRLAAFIRRYPFEAGLPFYTNYGELVYLFTGRNNFVAPKDYGYYTTPEYLTAHYADWPPAPKVYVVWFTSQEKKNYFSPDQLRAVADVELIYDGGDGQAAIVTRR